MLKSFINFRGVSLFMLNVLSFVFILSSGLPYYVNSSFLSGIAGEHVMEWAYIATSVLTIGVFIVIPRYLRRFGNYRAMLALTIANFLTILALGIFKNVFILLASFVITTATGTVASFCLDIFVEHDSTDAKTGEIRSVYIMVYNMAWLVVPWLSSLLVVGNSFRFVYLAGAAIMLPALFIIWSNLRGFKDPVYQDFKFTETLKRVAADKNIRSVVSLNFILQFFYSWMAIYTPIYLNQTIGFDWKTIGIIFSIMLIPFVFVQIPIGVLADRKLGEQEMLSVGFIIMALSTAVIPLITGANFWVWAAILFITRIGAAVVSTMSDVYFFKKVGEADANLISFYRTTYPFAYIIGPLAGGLLLLFLPVPAMFFILGLVMLFGLGFSLELVDTR